MATDDIQQEKKPLLITEAHPTFGKYLSHHPSNRIRLVIQSLILYAIPVLILQALFWNVEDGVAQRFLPLLFAAVGLGAFWYAAHFWNREVVLYEEGFSYRQGSQMGQFRYAEIARLQPAVSQFALLSRFQGENFNYQLVTIDDEILRISNLYSDIGKLITRLESYIARDRLVVLQQALNSGQIVDVGGGLQVSSRGLEYAGRELFWHEIGTRNIKGGILILRQKDNTEWANVPISDLNNPVLLLALLKQNAKSTGE